MSQGFMRFAACCLMLHASSVEMAWAQAQSEPSPAPAPAEAAQSFNAEQIDALVAPIALYPDPLLTQILMASTFPLQVVAAARWVDEPAHKGLSEDALTKALEPENWDPSVKSLVPFSEVLAKMNANLDWMQQLGYAFAEQQADVLDSVQRLRRQAQSNGSLQSTPQQVVRTEQQEIIIEPAQPNVIYVPSYNRRRCMAPGRILPTLRSTCHHLPAILSAPHSRLGSLLVRVSPSRPGCGTGQVPPGAGVRSM